MIFTRTSANYRLSERLIRDGAAPKAGQTSARLGLPSRRRLATKPAIRARSSLRTVLVYGSIMFAERRPPIGATLGRATAPPLRGPFCCGLHLGATIQATAAKPGVIIKISPGRD
jgi:hypothetical protein